MTRPIGAARIALTIFACACVAAPFTPFVSAAAAQASQTQPATVAASPYQRFAPIDLTGTWVSVVTEDWMYRMVGAKKGDFTNLPLTSNAQDRANNVDMAAVAAKGQACDAYGAPVIMREPGRVRISWQDDHSLRFDMDAGEQSRLFYFGAASSAPGEPSRQGFSIAEWQYGNGFDPLRAGGPGGGGRGRGRGGAAPADQGGGPAGGGAAGQPGPGAVGGGRRGGAGRGGPGAGAITGRLKVVTTNLTPGFLRKNGVPYSAATTVTEYYNVLTESGGTRWFVVTTIVHDPENLAADYITSTNFRQEPDNSKWRPRPCSL